MQDWEINDIDETELGRPGKWGRVGQTAVTLLILTAFLGVILITFYNQFTGRQTLPASLPYVAYLSWDEANNVQLFFRDALAATEPVNLTAEVGDVTAFAVSPSGETIIYVVTPAEGAAIIKIIDWDGRQASNTRSLYECVPGTCSGLVWHPDGRRLIFEKREGNRSQLWWLDSETGESKSVLADEAALSKAGAFSADGRWLSFVDPAAEMMVTFEFGGARGSQFPNIIGSPAVWHPDEETFLFSNFDLLVYHGDENATEHLEHGHDFSNTIHIIRGDTQGATRTFNPETGNVDDGNPAWSPLGDWIAFGRKPLGTNAGRQLWLMDSFGENVRALTDEVNAHFGPPTWSPDGRFLLMQRFDIVSPEARPEIVLLDLSPGKITQVAAPGFQPAWLP